MKTRTIIYADEGKILTDGEIYGKQIFLAEMTGLGQQKLNRILKGKQEITVADYELVCGALNVGIDEFSSPRILQQV